MNVYNKLSIKNQTAIDLKLEGLKYKEIAGQLEVKEQTIAEWFQTKGICYKAFQQRKQERAKERRIRFSQIDEQLQEMACDAISAIKHNLGKNSLPAAFGVLDRVGFLPIQKIQPISEPKVNIINYAYPNDEENPNNDSHEPYHPTNEDADDTLKPFIGS